MPHQAGCALSRPITQPYMPPYKKSIRIVGAVFGLYALLCATHLGEFWPFSIYPMFSSSAGKPWTRALVREVPPNLPEADLWHEATLTDLPGDPFPLAEAGIAENDIANYVSKTRVWDQRHVDGLRAVFEGHSSTDASLLVFKVRGRLGPEGNVEIAAMPLLLITPDSAYLNPNGTAVHP